MPMLNGQRLWQRIVARAILLFLCHFSQFKRHSTGGGQDQPPPLLRAGPIESGDLLDFSLYLFVYSVEEFQQWKALSDENYHQIENADIAFSKLILSLHGLSEKTVNVHSPEDALVETVEQQESEEMRRLLMEGLDNCLTPAQRRRLWLSCVCGHTVRQISQTENASFQNFCVFCEFAHL